MLARNILCVLVLLSTIFCNGQTDEINHQKYWYYKSRLNNDFIKVGLDTGESIPFTTRGRWAKSFDAYNVELGAGDATSIIGNYLALLSTELFLLKANNQNIDKVKHELFCALNAINRLDACAEDVWQSGSGVLNGFFIRDDIPSDFLKKPENFAHFNYYDAGIGNPKLSRGFLSKMNSGANLVNSDLIDNQKDPKHDISMSQDQVYNLLFGLMFVTSFVSPQETDGNNVFGYGSGETRLVQEAKNIANRIIDFTRSSKDLNGNICADNVSTGWSIKNPTTCNKVKRGSDAHVYAYALAEIQCMINYPDLASINRAEGNPFACGPNKYHNLHSSTVSYFLWNNTAKASIFLPSNPHYAVSTRQFNALLSSLCNCVYGSPSEKLNNALIKQTNNVPIIRSLGVIADLAVSLAASPMSIIPGFFSNITSSSITKASYINGDGSTKNPLGNPGSPFDHAPLARKILHGGDYIPNTKYSFKYLLDVAPCDNIYNLNNLKYGHYEWSSDNRIDQPDRRGWYGNNRKRKNAFKTDEWRPPSGEYNAIDFMLYHNLWYIHEWQEGRKTQFKDFSHVNINYRSDEGATTLKALETLEVSNAIYTNTDSSFWRAGKTILLRPGTEITGSNNIRVYIEKFQCATDDGQFATTAPPKEWNYLFVLPHAPTPVPTILKDEDLVIAPSVTEDKLQIYYDLEEEDLAFITIINMDGKIIWSLERLTINESGLTVDLSAHASGMYIVRLQSTSGAQLYKKVIKK